MNANFFKNKMKEVGSFLKIMKGKVKNRPQERVEGVNEALRSMEGEKQEYLKEKEAAENKVLRESGGQDISAI
ncbi:MAG: hypothetical protein NDI69_16710 [Bacteriovoracaceae bacterium]|nr:hypothetical protein [Bacteriovoracaceae bacterium]